MAKDTMDRNRRNGKTRKTGTPGHTDLAPVSVKLDREDKEALNWVCRIRYQTNREVIQQALRKLIDTETAGDGKGFKHYWHTHPGVYSMHLLSDSSIPRSHDEQEILEFSKRYWEFFYKDKSCVNLKDENVMALWERIHHFMSTSDDDFVGAGKEMVATLKAKGIEPPKWPRG